MARLKEETARILIVDDEKINLDVLSHILKDDYRTIACKDGKTALERASSKTPPDLILLDIMMPDMDGYEVCRRLKENPDTAEIPVIFVTAMRGTDDENKGFELGAVDYIGKPIVPTILLARVKTHLTLRRQQRGLEELHSLKTRFLGYYRAFFYTAVVLLALVTGVSQFIMHFSISDKGKTGDLISLAVGQSVLTQRTAKLFLEYLQAEEEETRAHLNAQLTDYLNQMQTVHKALMEGSIAPGVKIPLSNAVKAVFFSEELALDQKVKDYLTNGWELLKRPWSPELRHDPLPGKLLSETREQMIHAQDALVVQYELDSRERFDSIRQYAPLLLMLLIFALVTLEWVIFPLLVRRAAAPLQARLTE